MAILLIGLGLVALIGWAIWHEKRLRRNEGASLEEREAVSEQRRQLADQLLQARAQERALATEQALSRLEDQEQVSGALKTLAGLLPQCLPDEQWRILHALNNLLQSRYGDKPLAPPLPADLLEILQVMSSRPDGFRRQGSQHDCLRLKQLELQGLVLEGFNLRGAELHACNFAAARLPRLDLFAASGTDLDLKSARLEGANLTGASFKSVKFDRADLRKAELISAEFQDCSLQGTDLTGASLRGVRLNGCDLRGANLTDVSGLKFQQLLNCRLDAQTRLPEHLHARKAELVSRSQPS